MSLVTDPKEVDATLGADGQQKTYLVLSDEERANGFVRPVRCAYKHVGIPGPKCPLADLTTEQVEQHGDYGYVKYEAYPESESSSKIGRYWTQAQLDKVDKGCGTVTTMGQKLAETYAARPGFYGGTFCVGCKAHFPVGADGEFVWEPDGSRVGT